MSGGRRRARRRSADRPLQQITIDWTHDQSYYMQPGQGAH